MFSAIPIDNDGCRKLLPLLTPAVWVAPPLMHIGDMPP